MPAEDKALTRLNVALRFPPLQSLSSSFEMWHTLISRARNQRKIAHQPVLRPWNDKNQCTARGWNLGCWWISTLDQFFGLVPWNICLYFTVTKSDICVHLTYTEVCFFMIRGPTDRHWVISAFHLMLERENNGEECLLEIRKENFIAVKYFHYMNLITIWRWAYIAIFLLVSHILPLAHPVLLLISWKSYSSQLPLKGSIAKP